MRVFNKIHEHENVPRIPRSLSVKPKIARLQQDIFLSKFRTVFILFVAQSWLKVSLGGTLKII